MTITPVPALPPTAPGGQAADDASGQGGSGDGFAAFLAGLMAPAPETAGAVPGGPALSGSAASPLGVPVPAGAGRPASATEPADDTPSDQDAEATAADASAVPVPALALMTPLGPVAPTLPAAHRTQTQPVQPPGTAPEGATAPVLDAPAHLAAAETAPVESPAPVVDTGAAPAAATALTPGTAQPATAPAPPTGPATTQVVQQVAPTLARVVSRGEGVHRMSLTLHPADLGEVRLTVTVRGGHVDVQIAAGREARDLMREGSAELRHLLESVGRTAGAITFRDLSTGAAQPVQPGQSGPSNGQSPWQQGGTGPDGRNGSAQPGSQDPGGRHDGRGATGPAAEPVERSRSAGDATSRRTRPNGTGPAGLDLTI